MSKKCPNVEVKINNQSQLIFRRTKILIQKKSSWLGCNLGERSFSPSDQTDTVVNLPPGGAKVFRQPEVQLEGIETVPEIIQLTDEAAVGQVWNRAGTMTLSVRMMLQSPGLYSI